MAKIFGVEEIDIVFLFFLLPFLLLIGFFFEMANRNMRLLILPEFGKDIKHVKNRLKELQRLHNLPITCIEDMHSDDWIVSYIEEMENELIWLTKIIKQVQLGFP